MAAAFKQVLLEYAPASERSPLGGLFFRPSIPSLVFLLLVSLPILWLVERHTPWTRRSTIASVMPYDHGQCFTRDNHLITWNAADGLFAIDLATGKVDRTILPTIDPRNFIIYPLNGGRRVAAITIGATTRPVYDTATGHEVDQIATPEPKNLGLISDDGTRLISPNSRGAYAVWDLTSKLPADQMKPMANLNTYNVWFALDGKRIIQGFDHSYSVLDAKDLRPIAHTSFSDDGSISIHHGHAAVGPYFEISVRFPSESGVPPRFEVRSSLDGSLLDVHTVTGRAAFVVWSPDLSIKAVGVFTSGIWRERLSVDFIDRATGKLLKIHPTREMEFPRFFPDSRRYLVTTHNGPQAGVAVYDLHHVQPIARLDLPAVVRGAPPNYSLLVAPDSQTILAHDGSAYHILRRTGRDCPESHLGILAFPQTWLIVLFLSAAALSLLKDAQRSRSFSNLPPPRLMSTILFALALVLTLRFTLEACLGHLIYSGAPALLVCAIGLGTGSRIWRFLTLAGLCATLPLYLYYLNQMRNTGLRTIQAWSLFDRIYEVPQSLPFAILLLTTVAVLAAIVQLARPRAALLQ